MLDKKNTISHLLGEMSLALKSRLLSAREIGSTVCLMRYCVGLSGLESRVLDTLDCDH